MADKRSKGIKAYWAKIHDIQARHPGTTVAQAKRILQSGEPKAEPSTETPDGLIAIAASRMTELETAIEQTKTTLASQEAELAAYKRIADLQKP